MTAAWSRFFFLVLFSFSFLHYVIGRLFCGNNQVGVLVIIAMPNTQDVHFSFRKEIKCADCYYSSIRILKLFKDTNLREIIRSICVCLYTTSIYTQRRKPTPGSKLQRLTYGSVHENQISLHLLCITQ